MSPINNKNRKTGIISPSIVNLTKQKVATHKDELQVQVKWLNQLINAFNEPLAILDKNGDFVFYNKAAKKMMGNVLGWYIGKSYLDVNMQDNFKKEIANGIKKTLNGQTYISEVKYELNNEVKYQEVIFTPLNINIPNFEPGPYVVAMAREITDRKDIEKDLLNAKDQMDVIFKNISEGLNVFDKNGNLILINKKSANFLGYSSIKEALKAGTLSEVIKNRKNKFTTLDENGKKIKTKNIPSIRAFKGEKKPEKLVYHKDKATGKESWILLKSRPVFGSDGNLEMVVNIFIDVTRQKETENELRRSRQQMEAILQNVADAVGVFDPQGKPLFANHYAAKICGYDSVPKMLKAKDISEVLNNSLQRYDFYTALGKKIGLKELISKKASKEKGLEKIIHYRNKKTGEASWLIYKSKPILNEKGNLEMIVSIFNDIAEQKKAENELQNAKNQLDVIIQNIADGISVYDSKGGFLYINDNMWRLWGYGSAQEMLEKKNFKNMVKDIRKKIIVTDDYGDYIATADFPTMMAMHGAKEPQVIIKMEEIHTSKTRWLLSKSRPVFDDRNNLRLVVNIISDITEQKELEQRKDEFIGVVSHELRTPLTSIKAFAQILQRDLEKKNDNKSVKYLKQMNVQIDRFLGLVLELLDTTRIQTGGLVLHKEDLDLKQLIGNTVSDVSKSLQTHHIEIKDYRNVVVYADKNRVTQVLINLLSNASKYSPKSDRIIIEPKIIDNIVVVGVRDYGLGIPKEDLDKVFGRFYQVGKNKVSHDPSLGLGLYISAEIIKRHGGKMWVESEVNKGSVFYFTLPVKKHLE